MKKLFYKYWAYNQPKHEAIYRNYEQIKSVLIITPYPAIGKIVQQLQRDGKLVTVVPLPDAQEISFLGRPNEEIRQKLLRHYDLLIDLQQDINITALYMTLYANADLKTGIRRDDGLLDMMVDMPDRSTPLELWAQIDKYIKIIR